jgi:hypothetical protein
MCVCRRMPERACGLTRLTPAVAHHFRTRFISAIAFRSRTYLTEHCTLTPGANFRATAAAQAIRFAFSLRFQRVLALPFLMLPGNRSRSLASSFLFHFMFCIVVNAPIARRPIQRTQRSGRRDRRELSRAMRPNTNAAAETASSSAASRANLKSLSTSGFIVRKFSPNGWVESLRV